MLQNQSEAEKTEERAVENVETAEEIPETGEVSGKSDEAAEETTKTAEAGDESRGSEEAAEGIEEDETAETGEGSGKSDEASEETDEDEAAETGDDSGEPEDAAEGIEEDETAEETEEDWEEEEFPEEKQKLFFRVGEIAEKIWKNTWYQWFFTILLILALGSGAFAYRYIEQETSIDSVIEDYMRLFSSGDWEEMYEESGAEEAGILYSVWETAMSTGRTNSVDSYTYKQTGSEDGILYYTVTYREKGADDSATLEIALQETGEVLYHFFKTYEVTAAPMAIAGGTVTVPEGILFTFDSFFSEDLEKTEEGENCVYSLPVLVAGEYEVYLYGDTVEEQVYTVAASENARHFTWLDFELDEDIEEEMEEHLSDVVLAILSEAVEYGELSWNYGTTLTENYGHSGLEDWDVLGTAISDSLVISVGETGSEEEDGEGETAELLEIAQLTIDASETACYDFVYPDRCTVELVLDCSYTAASTEVDILDPDADDGQTRTGTMHMEFTATYLADPLDWQILDCTLSTTYTVDEPVAESEDTDE